MLCTNIEGCYTLLGSDWSRNRLYTMRYVEEDLKIYLSDFHNPLLLGKIEDKKTSAYRFLARLQIGI